jgi:hypothetical protein
MGGAYTALLSLAKSGRLEPVGERTGTDGTRSSLK